MKNLPINERPYEKLINNGAENLSDAELLAIIIKSGTKNMTALEISQRLLLECENNTLVAFLRENSRKGYDILKVIS